MVMNDSSSSTVFVKRAEHALEKNAAYKLRYHVFIEEMDMPLLAANHQAMTVIDDIDEHSHLYIACDSEGQVIGTLRVLIGSEKTLNSILSSLPGNSDFAPSFTPEQLCCSGRLAIHKDWRSSNALNALATIAYKEMSAHGALIDIIVCTPGLIGLYEHIGYRMLRHGLSFPDLGYRIPMILLLRDSTHLRQIRSPLLKAITPALENQPLAHHIEFPFNTLEHKDVLSTHFPDILQRTKQGKDTLFTGINPDDIARFLSYFVTINLSIGETFIVADTVGDEAFYILSGLVIKSPVADISNPPNDQAILKPGSLVGTHEFLTPGRRQAYAAAASDLTLLVIEHSSYARFSRKHPDTAAMLSTAIHQSTCRNSLA